jgi:hypothetical protein
VKKSDVAIIAAIAFISLVVAYLAGQAVLGQFKQSSVKVETVEPISSVIKKPDETIFSQNAINPAVPIEIGGSNPNQPFGQ